MMDIPNDLGVWVLAGQSNMEGVGALAQALPPNDAVFAFNSAGDWEVAQEPLHRLWESYTRVHRTMRRQNQPANRAELTDQQLAEEERRDRTNGVGPGLAFATAMVETLGRPVGLIPCAHGGTSLFQWSWEHREQGDNSLYGAMLDRINAAGGDLRGVLWYQGESDSNDRVNSRTYQQRLERWISEVRTDVMNPTLPVLIVQIARHVLPPGTPDERGRLWDEVREGQRRVAQTIPNVYTTTAVDLGLTDPIHIDSAAQHRLGRRLARIAAALEQGEVPVCPDVTDIAIGTPDRGVGVLHVHCKGVTGGWAVNPVHGFEILDASGHPHPRNFVVSAGPLPEDPATVEVRLGMQPNATDRIAYGKGLDPCCNLVDEADMPLPAFAPRGIGG